MNPLRAQFDALLAEYRRDLPAKLADLEALWAGGRVAELERALHTLGGSAGTFGLPEVGAAARAAEEHLILCGANPDPTQRRELAGLFAQLKQLGMQLASE